MSTADPVLAIDVGGTTIKGEVVGTDGTVLATERIATPYGGEAARTAVAAVGSSLLDRVRDEVPTVGVAGAGVVVPGLVDRDAGVAAYSANIGWRDLPLAGPLAARWGLPVRIANDVAAGGVAEHRLGAGRDEADMVFVPIGTGIAAAIVSGGRLLVGHRGETAEVGHLVVRPGTRCSCGGDGCLEAVASASAIARTYAERSGTPVTGGRDVADRVGADPVATAVWAEAVEALADALTAMSLLVSPALVVIGGGLGEAGETLLTPLRDAVARRSRIVTPPRLAVADHGSRGGVVGAALLARDGWEHEA